GDRKMSLGGEVRRENYDSATPPAPAAQKKGQGRWADRIRLVGVALLVCMIGTASFLVGIIYHLNPAWIFVGWNSIGIAALFIDDFRTHLKKPAFVTFLVAWAVIHGLFVVTLMRWLSIPAMLPFLAIELTVGYFLADVMFDIRPK